MNKEKVMQIIEEDVFPIKGEFHTAININQSGTLNEEKLKKERELYLKILTSWLAPELVNKTQDYPYNDISNVKFEADFVVIKRKEFDYIKKFVESIVTTKDLMNHE
jgi:cell fate regulator YaaT (PSP1 superfamily)